MSDAEFNSASFYRFLGEHKLMGCRNRTSGVLYLPPRPMCAVSHTTDMEWEQMAGEGELIAFSIIYIAPTHMVEQGYGPKNPYCAGIVRLKEGAAISGQILGVDVTHPESIRIGTPVKATFLDRGEGEEKRTFLGFEIA